MAYGAVGVLESRKEDAQTASAPLTFTLFALYFFAFWFVVENLDGLVSTIASFVPITAPLVMPLRLTFGHASAWEALAAVRSWSARSTGWCASPVGSTPAPSSAPVGASARFVGKQGEEAFQVVERGDRRR